ncbi:hypothetical protein M9458_045186, partial [Cirrhinus mrigala]
MESILSSLRNTEKCLSRDPDIAKAYKAEIQKPLDSGYVVRVPPAGQQVDEELWFILHHLVQHNGPTLCASLLGVLLRFRQYAVAISGDIRGMFHQVRLLPEDRPLLRFIWRNMRREDPPDIYKWHVLPFGTTCSPCCSTFALHMHVHCQQFGNEEVLQSIEQSFYVDNCLQSLPTAEEAKQLINKMRPLLILGFSIPFTTRAKVLVQRRWTRPRGWDDPKLLRLPVYGSMYPPSMSRVFLPRRVQGIKIREPGARSQPSEHACTRVRVRIKSNSCG